MLQGGLEHKDSIGQRLNHLLSSDRRAYGHVAAGKASNNSEALGAGDAMAINDAALLIFDLPCVAESLITHFTKTRDGFN